MKSRKGVHTSYSVDGIEAAGLEPDKTNPGEGRFAGYILFPSGHDNSSEMVVYHA